MNNSRAALGLLPTELLHRIAASLPCSSILNVCFTSRNLYAALYDRHVFKRSAVNVLYVDKYIRLPPLDDVQVESWELESCASEASEENSEDEWWPNLEEQDLDPEDDWDHADWGPDARQRKAIVNNDWDMNWPQASIFDALTAGDGARIAFAAEKANRIFNVCLHAQPWNRMVQWERESLVNWLPHLITLGHNSAMDLRPETFQLILWAPDILEVIENQGTPTLNPSIPNYLAVGFCIVALLLKRNENLLPGDISADGHSLAIREGFWTGLLTENSIIDDLKWELENLRDALKFDFKDRYTLLIYLIFRFYWSLTVADMPLPSLQLLPLGPVLGNPIPFRTPPEAFGAMHLTGDQVIELFSGEWTGRYLDKRSCINNREDGVIHPIHLSLREPEQNDPTEAIAIISSDSHGEDSWGPFTIAGSFFQDGEVWLVRSYEPHITEELATDTSPSNFRGIVTPFGIVGSWEVDRWTSPHYKRHIRLWYGFFWIWKKEWCRPWLEC